MKNKLIIKTRNFIFDFDDKTFLIGHPLVIGWRFLDDVKSIIEKMTLQLKARLMRGDDTLRKELTLFLKGKKSYQPFIHSNFQDVPFLRDGESRFKIIKQNLSVPKGTLLDIGANLGYFCHKFEDEGFDCCAVEEDRMLSYFAEKLKKAENKKFKVIPESIFEYNKNQEITFDVILALSIFHNLLARKDLYLNLIKLLKRLNAKELFFETYLPDPSRPTGYYKDYTPDQFVNFIIKNSSFNKAKVINKSEEERPLYKLTP